MTFLSYPSKLCVLQHMEANQRILLGLHCPSLRIAEKSVPLKIHYLKIEDQILNINHVKYSVFVIGRDSTNDVEPNGLGDFDKNGVRVDRWESQFPKCPDELYKEYCGPHDEEVENEHFYAENNRHVILLTVKFENSRRTERVAYTKYVYDAMKYLVWKIFDGRGPIFTERYSFFCDGLLRFPINFKLRPRHLGIIDAYDGDLDVLLSFLDTATFPLESLFINMNDPIDISSLPAKFVEISCYWPDLNLDEITHSNVHILRYIPTSEDIFQMIETWMQRGKKVGTVFKFNCESLKTVKELFKEIQAIEETEVLYKQREVSEPLLATIPMNDETNVEVLCGYDEEDGGLKSITVEVKARNKESTH